MRPVSAMLMLLASGGANVWADVATAAPAVQSASVEFNEKFLRGAGGAAIDVKRFNKGNVALPGTYRVDIYANEAWLGRASIVLREVGPGTDNVQPCFDESLLERVGVDLNKLSPQVQKRIRTAEHDTCVTFAELVKDGFATFDNNALRLDVSVPQMAMKQQARGYVDPKYWDDGVPAASLQYNANVFRVDGTGQSFTQSYMGLSAGVNFGPWRFRHSGNLTHDDLNGTHYQSIQTYLQRSLVSLKSQLTLGDLSSDGAIFDSFGVRGVQLASDDRMYPESQRGYAPTIRGVASSNAKVQIRQNGNIIYETTVAAGTFEISDLYPTGYGGNLDVIVTEADGSVHISAVPYAAPVNALRPGITRYGVVAGQYRDNGLAHKPWVFEATVQHGINNLLTLYGGVAAAQDYVSAALGAALNTRYGAIGLDVTQANTRMRSEPSRNGQSVRLSYSKLWAQTDTNLTVAAYRYSSRGFLSLRDALMRRDMDERGFGQRLTGVQKGRLQVSLSQSLAAGQYGTVFLSGFTQNYWDRAGQDTQYQAGYSNSFKRVNYSVTASRQLNATLGQWENRVMLNVGIPLGSGANRPYLSTAVQRDSSGYTSVQESLSGTLGEDAALRYGVNAGHSGGGNASSSNSIAGNAAYVTPFATLAANASKSGDYTQMGANLNGGIVAYQGGVAFAPYMSETMAIIEAKGASGARVTNSSGLRVDPWGHAVVPNLTPFGRNDIELDPKALPMSLQIKSTSMHVAPTAGAIVKLKFETENAGRAAVLRTKLADGKPLPFGAEVFDDGDQKVGTVGQAGRVIAYGLKADSGELTVKWVMDGARQCRMRYTLPKQDKSNRNSFYFADAECR